MSTNLYYSPIKKGKSAGGYGLKWALQKRFGSPVNIRLGDEAIEFLKGVSASSSAETADDADKLIEIIEKYGEVDLYEE